MSLWSYLYTELTRGYWLEHDKAKFTERRKRVYTFMKIPRELEKVCRAIISQVDIDDCKSIDGCLLVEPPALVLVLFTRQDLKPSTQLSSPRIEMNGNVVQKSLPCPFRARQAPALHVNPRGL